MLTQGVDVADRPRRPFADRHRRGMLTGAQQQLYRQLRPACAGGDQQQPFDRIVQRDPLISYAAAVCAAVIAPV